MKKIELDKNELKQFYIIDNHSIDETCEHFNCKKHIIYSRCRELSLHKNHEQISEKAKSNQQKRIDTLKKKYGVNNAFQLSDRQKAIKKMQKTRQTGDWNIKRKNRTSLIKAFAIDFYQKNNSYPTIMEIERKTGINHFIIGYDKKNNTFGVAKYIADSIKSSEEDIYYFLKAHDIKFILHDRTQIAPMELDFYLPDYQVAIEVNDVASHNSTINLYSGQKGKPYNYHFKKTELCNKKNIRLIHIWDYEWNNERQRPILENIILGACKKIEHRYFARKLNTTIITDSDRRWSEVNKFFRVNNIQGNRAGSLAVCLTLDNEIIMAYKYGHAFFGKGKYQWEVARGATKLNCQVVGGASRIWKTFIRLYNPESIVYYVDYNYFRGDGVKNLDNIQFIVHWNSFKNYWIEEGVVKNRDPMHNSQIKQAIKDKKVVVINNAGVGVYVWNK